MFEKTRLLCRSVILVFICIFALFLTISCTSESKKKERLVNNISRDMCKDISSRMSNGIEQIGTGDATVDALAITIINTLHVPMEDFCHCFTDLMNQELASRFTYKELLDLKKDKIKQLMVASKIIEQRDINAYIENCLNGTVQKKGKEYEDYQKSLDDKFKK